MKPRPAGGRALHLFCRAAAVAVTLLGAAVLAGWVFHIDGLKRVLPGLVAMNPITAAAFVCCGAALWLRCARASSPARRRTAVAFAAAATAAGATTLASYLSGVPGIDQMLFVQGLQAEALPNRMAPTTAVSFVFVGAALLLFGYQGRSGWRPAETLALIAGLLALVTLIGHGYGVRWTHELDSPIPMALHTAAGFVLLASGIVAGCPDRGLMRIVTAHTPGGAMARRTLPLMVVALLVLGWLRVEGERRGFFGVELGVALYTTTVMASIALTIVWNARMLAGADRARRRVVAEGERVFTLTRDMLCTVRFDGTILRANPAWLASLGYEPAALVGTNLFGRVHPEDEARAREGFAPLASGAEMDKLEIRYRAADGSYRWLLWSATPVAREQVFYAVARDVTDRHLMEQVLLDSRAVLEQRVRERTAQLAESEERVRHANLELERRVRERTAQLETANKELEAFSYSVSHDLRAPLRHVQGYVEMLAARAAGKLDDKERRYLGVITAASTEMGQLIDDLLSFSRMGRSEIRAAPLDLAAVAHEIVRGLEMETRDRRIEWRIHPMPAVMGDLAMIRQVLANLVGNAVKYTRGRDPAVIEVGCEAEQDGRAVVYVRDNGAGFDMQYVHKLFGVFQRLHRAEEFEGTGIGLATVRRIVARHGGRAWAEGERGKGATLRFTLELAPMQARNAA